jgi:hypothetical protein
MYFKAVETVYGELRGGSPYWQLENLAEACAEVADSGDQRAPRLGALAGQLHELCRTHTEIVRAVAMLFPDEAQRVALRGPLAPIDNFDDCV